MLSTMILKILLTFWYLEIKQQGFLGKPRVLQEETGVSAVGREQKPRPSESVSLVLIVEYLRFWTKILNDQTAFCQESTRNFLNIVKIRGMKVCGNMSLNLSSR